MNTIVYLITWHMSWLMYMQQNIVIHTNSGPANTFGAGFGVKTLYMGYVYMQSSVSAYRPCALSPFINKKHIK
jgi:hypothetical protein